MNQRTRSIIAVAALVGMGCFALLVWRGQDRGELHASARAARPTLSAAVADGSLGPPFADAVWIRTEFEGWTQGEPVADQTDPLTASIKLQVIDSDSRVLLEAEAKAQGPNDTWHRASRDEPIEMPAAVGATVVVRCVGMQTTTVVVPDPIPAVMTVQLEPGAQIRGHVKWQTNDLAGVDTRVLGWSDGQQPSTEAIRKCLGGEVTDQLVVGHVDADGSFELTGLRRRGKWTVTAAAPGGLALARATVTAGAGEEVSLTLVPTYACAVRVTGPDGERLVGSSDAFGRGIAVSNHSSLIRLGAAGRLSAELALLGIAPEFVDCVATRERYCALLTSTERLEEVGPIALGADVPGYSCAWTAISARPVAAEIPAFQLRLTRDAVATGTLGIRFQGPDLRLLGDTIPRSPVGLITLTELRTGRHVSLRLARNPTNEWNFDQIPVGTYRVRFTSHGRGYEWPDANAQSIIVDLHEGANLLEIPMNDTGAVHIVPITDAGNEVAGSMVVTLVECESRVLRETYFDQPPFAIDGVFPGCYELEVRSPTWEQVQASVPQVIDVRGGAVSVQTVDVR